MRDELPLHVGKIEKHLTIPAINTRQAHFAALQTVLQNSHWLDSDAKTDFDIARHVHDGKHTKQLEQAIDEVLADEVTVPVGL